MFSPSNLYVDLSVFPNVKIDLKYASVDNFMGENLYGDFKKAYLHQDAALKFEKAISNLQREKRNWFFIVFDALRPRSVQRKMWDRVKDTPHEKYIADPEKGSPHNFGMALDLSLLDERGIGVDMGAGFDEFKDISEPRLEAQFLKEGKLSFEQFENRMILRQAMTQAGFLQLPHEWWHYNALLEEDIRRAYPIIN